MRESKRIDIALYSIGILGRVRKEVKTKNHGQRFTSSEDLPGGNYLIIFSVMH